MKACIELLRKTPSSFIKGELLQLLTKWVYKDEARAILPIVTNLAKSKDVGVAAKSGAMSFLCRAETLGLGQLSHFVLTQPGLVQSLSIAQLPDGTLFSPKAIKTSLQRKAVEPGLAFAVEAVRRRKTFNSLGVKKSAMPTQVWNLFVELDMTQGPYADVDPMAELLHRRYGIANTPIWKAFFVGEYMHAHRQLMQAEKLFDMGRSQWLNYQNSFNHAAFLVLQEHLNRLKLPGACATKDRHGQLISYGSMLSGTHPFPTNYPHIAVPFDAANRRRNKLDSSHPYDSKTGSRNSALTKREQLALVAQLRRAFEELVNFCGIHGIL